LLKRLDEDYLKFIPNLFASAETEKGGQARLSTINLV
jgi:hypothetical protein